MPFFAAQLEPKQQFREGDCAHFECRVVPPQGNKVEWFHDDKPLAMGHRYKTMHDFGFISLDILYVYPEDSGTYMCRATSSSLGTSCETRSVIHVQARQTIIHETQCLGGMERLYYDAAGMKETNYNYQSGRADGFDDTDTISSCSNSRSSLDQGHHIITSLPMMAPMVTMPMVGTERLMEGERAHLECRIEPVNDARIKIEFLHNGKPLVAGSRYHIMSDFGYISLDIDHTTPEDSGVYTVRACNPAITSGDNKCESSIRLHVQPVCNVQTQTLHAQSLAKLQKLELDTTINSKPIVNHQLDGKREHETFQRPVFTKPLTPDSVTSKETSNVDFHCRLIPVSDSKLTIEWLHNGRQLQASSRRVMEHEFGVARLKLRRLETSDSGIYQCRARNTLGEAVTTGKLRVTGDQAVQTESLMDDEALHQIRLLDQPKDCGHQLEEKPREQAPKFISRLNNLWLAPNETAVRRHEGESFHLHCQYEPQDDPNLKLEWYLNDRVLVRGSRVHTVEDFGFAYLDIDYLYKRDGGEYMCRVSNKFGSDTTKIVLHVTGDKGVVMESQLPNPLSADRLRQLDFGFDAPEVVEEKPAAPVGAHFVKKLIEPQPNVMDEGASVHFECSVEPKQDPDLQVQWYHNGKALIMGHRHRANFDFGQVTLDLLHVYAEDSGTYMCVVTNKSGKDTTEASIKVHELSKLVKESQLPKNMRAGYERLAQMEKSWSENNTCRDIVDDVDDFCRKSEAPPEFTMKPKPVDAFEGSVARFCCRLQANPPARLVWMINGEPVITTSRYKVSYDGLHHLEIKRCTAKDSGEIKVMAKNSLGMCQCTTQLTVKTRQTFVTASKVLK